MAHRTPTRIRIKLAKASGKTRGPRADLTDLKQHLLKHPDVLGVQLNPLTASLIIECRKGFELTARHRQLLRLDMQAPKHVQSAHDRPGPAATDHDTNGLSGTLMLAHVLKLIVAISTRQIGTQLIECAVDGLIQAARSEAQRRAAVQKPLVTISAR
ncbi:hypothetical protein [Bradyrhizobium sp. ARR65]|uniref:hypothetical protein n=1 Tax=Bradyrhizobium sp. ARR65 TaxID=1040989 RepID=UPI0012F9A34E|nr:hypothetical protein [Bradyrhizobium sp. ARR65]